METEAEAKARRKQLREDRLAKAAKQEQQLLLVRERLAQTRHAREDLDLRSYNAIVTSLVPRIRGSINTWCRKRVPLDVNIRGMKLAAMTNFKSIMVTIPQTEVSVNFMGDLRGLCYHEAGHIIKSVALTDLFDVVLPQRGSFKFGHGPAWNYLSKVFGLPALTVHRAWNVLEDQRMETAMVQDSVNLADYFNVIVLTHLVRDPYENTNWFLLIGREHVDADVRVIARAAAIDAHGEDRVLQAEDLVDTYICATDPFVMWECVLRFAMLLQGMGMQGDGSVDSHSFNMGDSPGDEQQPAPPQTLDELAEKQDEVTDALSKGAATPTPKEPSKEGDTVTPPGPFGNDTRKAASDALDKAKDKRNEDERLLDDLRAFKDAYNDTRSATPLRRLLPKDSHDRDRLREAAQVTRSLQRLFEQARSAAAPSWQRAQTAGILDPVRYRTHKPGERTFFRNYAADGDLYLPDLAVSLVLDGSGSMEKYEEDLGMAAWAVKQACGIFNIPCTVSVYNDEACLLWDANDKPQDMPGKFIPKGMTDPTMALDLIDSQAQDKARHLVIIMTDGAWQGGWGHHGTKTLDDYRAPHRDIVVLFWNTPEKNLRGLERTTHQQIKSLMEMPKIVRKHILAAL